MEVQDGVDKASSYTRLTYTAYAFLLSAALSTPEPSRYNFHGSTSDQPFPHPVSDGYNVGTDASPTSKNASPPTC